MKLNEHSSTIIIVGTIASSLGLLMLSFEIILVQIFRFYMWTNGVVPTVSNSVTLATSANDIISTSWIPIAFIITVIVALLGIILLLIGVRGMLSSKFARDEISKS